MLAECEGLDEKRHRLRQVSSGMRTGPLGLSVCHQKVGGGFRFQQEQGEFLHHFTTCILLNTRVCRLRRPVALSRVRAISRWRAKNADFSIDKFVRRLESQQVIFMSSHVWK